MVALLASSSAAADRPVTFINHAPRSAAEADRMEVIYHGRSYTWTQIGELQKQGRATGTVEDPASYAKGQAHAFDTEAEADAWACAHIAGLAVRPTCDR